MKKTKLTRSLLAACSIVALSAVMYGCSSSGENAANTRAQNAEDALAALQEAFDGEGDLTVAALDKLEADLATAQADLATANTDLATANGNVTRLEGELATANGNVTRLTGELATANADVTRLMGELSTANADVTRLMGELSAAQADVTRLTGELSTANADVTRLQGELTAANKRADDAEKELADKIKELEDTAEDMAKADRIARSGLIITAIARAADGSTRTAGTAVANIAGVTTTPAPSITGITATRDVAGAVSVDVNGDVDDEYDGGDTTAGSGDWTSVTLTKANDDTAESSDTVVVYTDVDAPADSPFNTVYDLARRGDILGGADAAGTARRKLASADSFPSGASQTSRYGGDSGNAGSFAGMFDGVAGTYECTVTADAGCTLTTNADGELQASTANDWRFTPNNNLATVKVPDGDHSYFGWWLNKPKANDATATHTVEVFAGSNNDRNNDNTPDTAPITNAMAGKATYSGPAAGKYATRTFTAGVLSDAGVGHFTANASLTANFRTATDTTNTGSISGAITGFMLDGTTSVPWRVVLESSNLTDGSNATAPSGTPATTKADFGGGVDAATTGTWTGAFHDADEDDDNIPGTLVGTFGASITNASVHGAFGAKKQ